LTGASIPLTGWDVETSQSATGGWTRWVVRHRGGIALALLLLVVAIAHGYNMLHYPYVEDDEGTYFSQAWSVLHLGKLTPYTYIYDHPPLGWIQIAAWQLLTAGARLGPILASGRVLMLLFQLGCTWFVFGIGRRASGRTWVGLLAAALAALLPFGIAYQRRILLDNVATFWLLASIYGLSGRVTLSRIWMSAIALAIAILSKEIVVAALPALTVLVARRSPRESRSFALAGWLGLSLLICSIYLLLALVKGEFFPAGTALGGYHPHVSLLCTLLWQASRNADGGILASSSAFWTGVASWVRAEPVLTLGGSAAMLWLILFRRRNVLLSMLGWTAFSLWLFLGRGGIVQDFYLVPLLPLLALCLALALNEVAAGVRRWAASPRGAAAVVIGAGVAAIAVGAFVAYRRAGDALWTANPVRGQDQAIAWIRAHLPRQSRIVIDNYMWYDLHVPESGAAFRNAVYYWDVGYDPQLRRKVFGNDWRDVDYVVSTPQMIHDVSTTTFPVVTSALEHSVLVRSFDTAGWTVQVRRVEPHAFVGNIVSASAPLASEPTCMTYQ
jgi:4-amino-4-deoxy-L-arabinose transferase-like glycosyltransferase